MVTDVSGHPVGEVRLNKLLCTQRPRRIVEIMDTEIRSIPVTMDQEEVALLFRRYGMVSTGVIDAEGRLVGIITLDDIIDVIDEEAEEDLMALAGVSDASIRTSVLETLKGRAPWLFVNLITAVIASVVIGFFESTIEKIVALAVLMPIVASMGGNAGTQTVTIAVRAIAMREFSPKVAVTFGLRELYVGVANGLIFAVVTAGLSYVWFSDAHIAGAWVCNAGEYGGCRHFWDTYSACAGQRQVLTRQLPLLFSSPQLQMSSGFCVSGIGSSISSVICYL